MTLVSALYLVLLAAVAGYVLIARVPSILHTPLLSGSNFIHGIVLAGAMLALSGASGTLETLIGFLAVMAASANVVGGFVVTDRMLNLFNSKEAVLPGTARVNSGEESSATDVSGNRAADSASPGAISRDSQ